jgi:hypothetical protein
MVVDRGVKVFVLHLAQRCATLHIDDRSPIVRLVRSHFPTLSPLPLLPLEADVP